MVQFVQEYSQNPLDQLQNNCTIECQGHLLWANAALLDSTLDKYWWCAFTCTFTTFCPMLQVASNRCSYIMPIVISHSMLYILTKAEKYKVRPFLCLLTWISPSWSCILQFQVISHKSLQTNLSCFKICPSAKTTATGKMIFHILFLFWFVSNIHSSEKGDK